MGEEGRNRLGMKKGERPFGKQGARLSRVARGKHPATLLKSILVIVVVVADVVVAAENHVDKIPSQARMPVFIAVFVLILFLGIHVALDACLFVCVYKNYPLLFSV